MKSLILSILLVLIAIAGLILNGYILIVIFLTKQLKSPNHLLLVHLAFIDISSALAFLAFYLPGINGKEWSPSGDGCLLYGFLFALLQPLAIWTICGLNCERFYVIAVPLRYSRIVTSKKVLTGLGAIWTVSILLSTPPIFANVAFSFTPRLGICETDFLSKSRTLWYSTAYVAFTLLLPATFIIVCNVKIFIIARYQRHRIASAIYQVAISAQVAITHQKNPFSWSFSHRYPSHHHHHHHHHHPVQKFRSAAYTTLQFLGPFVAVYAPHYSLGLVDAVAGERRLLDGAVAAASSGLLLAAVPLNGLLYGVKDRGLRTAWRNYCRKRRTALDLHQEIQARTPSTCGSRRPSVLVKPEHLVDVVRCSPRSNTLQVPSGNNRGVSLVTEDELCRKLNVARKSGGFFGEFFRCEEEPGGAVGDDCIPLAGGRRDKSPKILLTQASTCRSDSSLADTGFGGEESGTFQPLLYGDERDSDKEGSDVN
ncbi:unnamed protein product [Phyllotreta striolata]|uniref:G-protein coupled receptors family 1 profile domain-containing protein n=1 Tax=Phyllotreta striolata TaxID=444603 RepID=A0A9N9TWC0_PHYSR|nr:unnamed protein product [Phyllotreta striolata]